jgi:hypothetical protein
LPSLRRHTIMVSSPHFGQPPTTLMEFQEFAMPPSSLLWLKSDAAPPKAVASRQNASPFRRRLTAMLHSIIVDLVEPRQEEK